jgi:hypothetical protein
MMLSTNPEHGVHTRPTLSQVVGHELVGHAFETYAYGSGARGLSEEFTRQHADNVYLAAIPGAALRCGH